MMKTYWVLSKKSPPNSETPLNPLQKSKKTTPTTRTRRISFNSSIDIGDILETNEPVSPTLPRYNTTPQLHPSLSPRPSLSPEDWPAMNRCLIKQESPPTNNSLSNQRLSTVSALTGVLKSHKGESVDYGTPNGIPTELLSLASENLSSVKEFEQLAEENAQNARKIANWAHYIASVCKEKTTPTNTLTEPRPSSSNIQHRRATVATVTAIGTPVDREDVIKEEETIEIIDTPINRKITPTSSKTTPTTGHGPTPLTRNDKDNCTII